MKPLLWVAVNLIGFVILVFMYINTDKTSLSRSRGRKLFKYLQIIIMLYIIFDTGMYIMEGMSFFGAREFHYTFSLLYYFFAPLPGLVYLLYCDTKVYPARSGLRKRLRLYSIPFIINILAVILTPFANLIFAIDENNIYLRGKFFWISFMVAFIYLLLSYPLLAVKTKNKQVLAPKGGDIYMYLFPIPIIILAILQMVFYGTLLLGMSFVISAYYIYTNNIQSSGDKRSLFVRFFNINIMQFAIISFILIAGLIWSLENMIKDLSNPEYLAALQTASFAGLYKFLPPFVIMTILFFLFVFSVYRITQQMIFTPLKQLVESLINMKKDSDHEIYGLDRDDEIGLLSNTIKDLFIKGHYDGLTGVYNRRYMEMNLQRIMATLSRTDSCLSVIMLDVDFFKKYNDTYGHGMGDDCLRDIAQALNKIVIRRGDFLARYGGEEFIAILPNTKEAGALHLAEKMLSAVRQLEIPHEKNESGFVTLSIGITTGYSVQSFGGGNAFVKKADEALYQSKQNGRNQSTFLALN